MGALPARRAEGAHQSAPCLLGPEHTPVEKCAAPQAEKELFTRRGTVIGHVNTTNLLLLRPPWG